MKRRYRNLNESTLGNFFERFETHNFDIIIENEIVDSSIQIMHNTLLEDLN